ncbi:hypothetical protein FQN60_010752 [Etheostoma spectabile]|uniref:Uncharacterized protein n=1 Tax=Etheostoma spectabile TaxID=54343 RepID=A0A5J5DQE7_9PERO|nr:hypothetical protein FQN60_010752 [Etheostoma spectabile]
MERMLKKKTNYSTTSMQTCQRSSSLQMAIATRVLPESRPFEEISRGSRRLKFFGNPKLPKHSHGIVSFSENKDNAR